MKKLSFIAILIFSITIFLYGCSNSSSKLEDYIKTIGYTSEKYNGEVEKYTLTKDKLLLQPYDIIWGLQKNEATNYINKDITTYEFIVTKKDLKDTKLYLMMCDDEIIGGYSFPNNDSVGSYYSLDGKTLEEFTGLNLTEWQKDWKDKYSKK